VTGFLNEASDMTAGWVRVFEAWRDELEAIITRMPTVGEDGSATAKEPM